MTNAAFQNIEKEILSYANSFPDKPDEVTLNMLANIASKFSTYIEYSKKNAPKALNGLWHSLSSSPFSAQLVMRFELMWHIADPEYTNEYINIIIQNESLTWEQKYFFQIQLSSHLFTATKAKNKQTGLLMRKLYRTIYSSFTDYINVSVNYYTSESRNEDMIFVMTSQFLSLNHGPTKTALDRCYELIKNQHKKVVLINTGEDTSKTGAVYLFSHYRRNYIPEYSNLSAYTYMDIEIPFMQFPNSAPDYESTLAILNVVDKYRPYFIMHIGGGSMITDICSRIVPTVVLATVPSGISTTEGTFQIIGHTLTKDEENFLEQFGKNKEHVLECLFTSSFKPQKYHFSRSDLNLPDDKFVIAVVGGRLTTEVTDEFLDMFSAAAKIGAHIAFIGRMNNYEKMCDSHPYLLSSSTYMGIQKDVLAVLECCDLYVNPYRTGGGTSVVEAMYKGLPCATLHHGDVALGAGDIFCVNDYSEMSDTIIRYMTDASYYSEMSNAAKMRAHILTDTHSSFSTMLHELDKRIKDYESQRHITQ